MNENALERFEHELDFRAGEGLWIRKRGKKKVKYQRGAGKWAEVNDQVNEVDRNGW